MTGICYHCHRLKEIVLIGKYELCEEHQNLKQYQPKVKVVSISKVSKSLKNELKIYHKLRHEFLNKNKKCQFKGCIKPSEDVHHMKGRGMNLNKTEYFMAVCRHHHNVIEHNPEYAYEMGYSLKRI